MTQGIRYIGTKQRKVDNVAGTGLHWLPNAINIVGDVAAGKLLDHPDVWTAAPEVFTEEGVHDLYLVAEDQQAVYAASLAAAGGTPLTPLANTETAGLTPIAAAASQQPAQAPKEPEDSARMTAIDAPNLHGMTKPDIAAYAQREFGVELDASASNKKEAMIDQVIALRNARDTHGQEGA